jgi:S1-C subfamily serine protease
LSETLSTGATGAVQGYPFGGPFSSIPAEVISVSQLTVPDIYGENATPREVYTLATGVEQGNSGGPLLSLEGEVAGVVFAKGQTQNDIGYAMTMAELQPVVDVAPSLSLVESSGSCTPR